MFAFLTTLSLLILLFAIGWMIFCMIRHKGKSGIYKPLNILSIGVIATGFVLYVAYYQLLDQAGVDEGVTLGFFEGFFTIIHDVYQLFSADSDYTGVFAEHCGREILAEIFCRDLFDPYVDGKCVKPCKSEQKRAGGDLWADSLDCAKVI